MSTLAEQVIGLRKEKAQLEDDGAAIAVRIRQIEDELDAIAAALDPSTAPASSKPARKPAAKPTARAKAPAKKKPVALRKDGQPHGGRKGRPRLALPDWMDRVRAALAAGGPMSPKAIQAATGLESYQFRRASQELHRTKTVTSSGSTKQRLLRLA